MHYACDYDHQGVIKALCQAGANINLKNQVNITPYGIAAKNSTSERESLTCEMMRKASHASHELNWLMNRKRNAEDPE